MAPSGLGLVLGLVPARGGSRGVPRKNVAPVAGKPLIVWTLEAALQSRALDRIVVSTEDPEIAAVARHTGAEVPFTRPPELSRDDTPGIEPVLHALEALGQSGYTPDWVMVLQPTSPLRTREDIQASLELLRPGVESVISVCESFPPPQWLKTVNSEGIMTSYLNLEDIPSTRQELPKVYALNGAIYLARRGLVLGRKSFYADRTHAYIMPRERSIDVDTPWDLKLVDLLLRHRGVSPS